MKIQGIKNICTETKSLSPYDSRKLQVFYCQDENKAWSEVHVGNSWSEYHDDSIIDCGFINEPQTQKEIIERIENYL